MKLKNGMIDILCHVILNFTKYAISKAVKLLSLLILKRKDRITKMLFDSCDTVFCLENLI